jgi:hypothetical protein
MILVVWWVCLFSKNEELSADTAALFPSSRQTCVWFGGGLSHKRPTGRTRNFTAFTAGLTSGAPRRAEKEFPALPTFEDNVPLTLLF